MMGRGSSTPISPGTRLAVESSSPFSALSQRRAAAAKAGTKREREHEHEHDE